MQARRLRIWAGRGFVATWLVLAPVVAGAQAPQQAPPVDPAQEARALAVGNAVQVVYHLVAQELIDQLALQRPADAGDAADQIATVLMIAASDDPAEDPLLLAAMRGLTRAVAHAERTGTRLPYWAGRGLDRARAASMLCAFYGSQPDEYRALADEIGLTEEQRRGCGDAFVRLVSAWGPLLKPHAGDTGDTRPGRGSARVSWQTLEGYHLGEEVRPLRESGAIERIASTIAAGFRLPRDVTIRLEPCGRIEAARDPQRQAIVVCYELVEAFNQLMAAEMRERPRP